MNERMPSALHCLVGTIRVEPDLRAAKAPAENADSTLGLLLESLAFQESLAGDYRTSGESIRLLISTRLCRIQAVAEGNVSVRANLAQLTSDLNADYERLAIAGTSGDA
jgi:hypothetical protein